MRMLILAATTIVAGGMGLAAGTTPAVAQYDPMQGYPTQHDSTHAYPICMHWKYDSVLCHFNSLAECMATASGIGGDCIQNPGYAGYDEPPPRPIVRRYRHHRYHHDRYSHHRYHHGY